jgi:predicted ATPase/DNA-binding SARP family transcriptional activator
MRIRVRMLGSFEVRVGERALDASDWKLRHPRQLLQMLVLQPGQQLSRDHAVQALWPNASPEAAGNRLHHTLHVLRTTFVRAGVAKQEPVLALQAGVLGFGAAHHVESDVSEFRRAIEQARRGAPDEQGLLTAALALYRGELLGGNAYEDWLATHRDACRHDYLWGLDRLGALHREQQAWDAAIALYQKAVEAEPANELAHRTLMELFERTEHPERAIYQYSACRRFLQRDLDAEPSPATQALFERIVASSRRRDEQLQLEQSHRVARAAAAPRKRYVAPPHAGKLLGREADLETLQRWIGHDRVRLLTITGTLGMGKSRLGHALAERCQDGFEHGVVALALGGLDEGAQVLEQLAAGLRLDVRGSSARDAVASHLAKRSMLLLLDRFEHLLADAALVPRLLAAAPRLVIVVTSQAPLRCEGERVYEVPALSGEREAYAVQLFCSAAYNSGIGREQLESAPAVAAICRRLGGNALAIELAAAQTQLLSLAQIEQALKRPLDLLTSHTGDAEEPHRSLRHAIEWSCGLLDPPLQRLFAGLGVFAAAFSLDDAVQTLAHLADPARVQAACDALAERHLIDRVASGSEAGPRFVLLDAPLQFTRELALEPAERAADQAAHAAHFAHRTHRLASLLREGQAQEAIVGFQAGQANLRAAVDWFARNSTALQFLQLVTSYSAIALIAGARTDAARALRLATKVGRDWGPQERHLAAGCAFQLGRLSAWRPAQLLEVRSLRLARRLAQGGGDTALSDRIVKQLATVRMDQMRLRTARCHVEGLIRRHEASADVKSLVSEYGVLATIRLVGGEPRLALQAAERGLDCALARFNPKGLALALTVVAEVCLLSGDMDRARHSVDMCLAMPEGTLSVLRSSYLRLFDFVLAFECADFEGAFARIQRLLLLADDRERAVSQIFVTAMSEWMQIELGRHEQVRVLERIDLQGLPHNWYFTDVLVRNWGYRMRLDAARGAWYACQQSCAQLLNVMRWARSPLRLTWAYEACCHTALARGAPRAARGLLAQSRRFGNHAGAVPAPRLQRTWAIAEAALERLPAARGGLDKAPPRWVMARRESADQLLAFMSAILLDPVPQPCAASAPSPASGKPGSAWRTAFDPSGRHP